MHKYIGIALLSCLIAYSQSALAVTDSNELFKHSIGSEYTENHDPNLEEWKAHELSILNKYTKYAQQQISSYYELTNDSSKKRYNYNLVAENKNWSEYMDQACTNLSNYDPASSMHEWDRNLCEISMIRQRTYFIWGYFLHDSNGNILNKPNINLSFPEDSGN